MKKWGRERQEEKEEARRRIGEPACAPCDQAPTSEYFFILPSDFIVRCLTFANFVNFCSKFSLFLILRLQGGKIDGWLHTSAFPFF